MTDELNVNAEAENAEEITNHVEEVQVTEEPTAEVEPTQETIEPVVEVVAEVAEPIVEPVAEVVAPQLVETPKREVKVEEEEVDEPIIEKTYYKHPVVSLEDFDWNAINKKVVNYSEDERIRLEGIYDKTFNQIVEQEVVDGIIVAKNAREVVINIGFKSDGVIPVNEIRYNPDLKIGDTIEVYVESQEDASGQLILSHKKARILKSWDRVNKVFETQEIITGYVKCRTKGGLIVDVFGIEAFLQIGRAHV